MHGSGPSTHNELVAMSLAFVNVERPRTIVNMFWEYMTVRILTTMRKLMDNKYGMHMDKARIQECCIEQASSKDRFVHISTSRATMGRVNKHYAVTLYCDRKATIEKYTERHHVVQVLHLGTQ